MVTFTIPSSGDAVDAGELTVNSTPENLSREQLLAFPAFKIWLSTLQRSLARQKNPSHEFHKNPYVLRGIEIQAVDFFRGGRLGFVKLRADVSNQDGESLPGSVFLRGGSVGILLILQPDDTPPSSDEGKHVILTVQPRIPAGSLAFPEIPAGMLDDSGTFAGSAAKEIQEETGLSIAQDELIDMTSLALTSLQSDQPKTKTQTQQDDNNDDEETLQKAVYPSPGGSDEFIPLFLCQKRMPRSAIDELQGRLTGLRHEGEKITLKVVPLENVWKEGSEEIEK
ncbi:Nucleoside diphosphate-sugar hydrolase of the MutT [Rasamsonia emersonii CBS 393.64]|uniref:Nucleoside diphosphate-sugar hydrolase of the MutT n=1 Tax=Rasamsonia emersonii (strain ATCC 16479 / CBS 393.64 / IMI 116815) TaxID=1408163 RepID=A0A0F4YF90_RASE3|nr:Nucleoside diphosphate-sugar hydrolase of the MutT [Rasamsonia emersonii CBS 393.64]KKA16303.1 Nucleoside diphosphate-sugar hydrolase of the MutT [Rasamsonia emersonii CBS 393.64]